MAFLEGCDEIKKNLDTLNGNFVREGGYFPFYGFPKPWMGKDGKMNPDWKIFFEEKFTFKEKPTVVIEGSRRSLLDGLHGC